KWGSGRMNYNKGRSAECGPRTGEDDLGARGRALGPLGGERGPAGEVRGAVIEGLELPAAPYAELAEDAGEMGLYGRLADREPRGDLLVAQPLDRGRGHLVLAGAQLSGGGGGAQGLPRAPRRVLDQQGDHVLPGPDLPLVDDLHGLGQLPQARPLLKDAP